MPVSLFPVFKGEYHLYGDAVFLFSGGHRNGRHSLQIIHAVCALDPGPFNRLFVDGNDLAYIKASGSCIELGTTSRIGNGPLAGLINNLGGVINPETYA